jgi:rare lipoprotein A
MKAHLIFLVIVLSVSGCGVRSVPPPLPAQTITPTERPSTITGEASVYADKFQGRKTANGERFDQRKLTAASRTLAFGSVVKVTNKNTGKSVKVRINDRGPYAKGRVIDLSKAAAVSIGMHPRGLAPVIIETGETVDR